MACNEHNGITHLTTSTQTPEHNGLPERKHYQITENNVQFLLIMLLSLFNFGHVLFKLQHMLTPRLNITTLIPLSHHVSTTTSSSII